jgi:hypothetical protein
MSDSALNDAYLSAANWPHTLAVTRSAMLTLAVLASAFAPARAPATHVVS